MTENKYCPLKFNANNEVVRGNAYLCDKEDCAWWDNGNQECSVVSVVVLSRIAENLLSIVQSKNF